MEFSGHWSTMGNLTVHTATALENSSSDFLNANGVLLIVLTAALRTKCQSVLLPASNTNRLPYYIKFADISPRPLSTDSCTSAKVSTSLIHLPPQHRFKSILSIFTHSTTPSPKYRVLTHNPLPALDLPHYNPSAMPSQSPLAQMAPHFHQNAFTV